ncbi:tryptophanase leader peptide [Listeria ivanovii]
MSPNFSWYIIDYKLVDFF